MAKRILIIDRNEPERYETRGILETAGYQVAEAPTPDAARRAHPSFRPDALISDLPPKDVIGFLQDLGLGDPPPPLLVLGEPSDEAAQDGWSDRTVVDYVGRPVSPQALVFSLNRALKEQEIRLDNIRYQSELEAKDDKFERTEKNFRRHAVALEEKVERRDQALLETELRYRELFNLANDAIFAISAESGQIIDTNLQAERILGYSHQELINMKVQELHAPEDMPVVEDFERQVSAAGCGCGVTGDLPFQTKSGQRVILNVSCSLLELEGQQLIHRICRDVTDLRKLEAQLAGYTRQLEGKFEEKTRLLLDSQAQLAQAEKMAAVGSLVAGIAHEINTPLGSINSNNDIFALSFEKVRTNVRSEKTAGSAETDEELAELMSILEDAIRTNRMATERIVKIVRSLRNFARLDEAERKKVDIHEGIESTLILVAHELKRRIKVVKEFADLPEIECYPNQLNQVFMNMLVNASQAIEGTGEIRIRTWLEGDTVRIAISDNGKGIPPEVQGKVFEPGFTTKKAGLGTGLGLSICYKIIQEHGGRIEVKSEVGQGTTFTIILPITDASERKSNG